MFCERPAAELLNSRAWVHPVPPQNTRNHWTLALPAMARPPGVARWSLLLACAGASSAIPIFLLLMSATTAVVSAVDAGTSIIALTLPSTTSGYFPLSEALGSIMRLAAADINAEAEATTTPTAGGNLTLSIVEVATGTRAIEGLCDALASVGGNGTFGVGASTSSLCIFLVGVFFCPVRYFCCWLN